MGDGHNYNVYFKWQLILPSVAVGISFLVMFVFAVIMFFCQDKSAVRGISFQFAKVILEDNLKKKEEDKNSDLKKTNEDENSNLKKTNEDENSDLKKTNEDENSDLKKTNKDENSDKYMYILFERYRSIYDVNFAAIWALWLLCMAFVTFWEVFLLDDSFACDEDMDCFVFNSTGDLLQQEPLQNCSDFELSDNYTVTCYKFVFNYAEAFGIAGGVFVLAPTIAKIYIIIILAVVPHKGDKKNCKFCLRITGIVAIGVVSVIFCIIAGVLPVFSLVRDTVFKSGHAFLQYYTHVATAVMMITYSLILGIRIMSGKMHVEDSGTQAADAKEYTERCTQTETNETNETNL